MTTTSATRTTSLFVWHDLMTPDPDAAVAFYTALFGWTTEVMDMGEMGDYTMFVNGGAQHAGVVHLDADAGHPPHWIGYLAVDDVNGAAAKTGARGGRVLVEPFDIPGVGRTAVLADPTGAVFSPFRGSDAGEMPPSGPQAGAFAWHELMTPNPDAARPYYTDLTGWRTSTMDMGEAGPYGLFHRGEDPVAGLVGLPSDDVPAHWVAYIGVADLDEAAARAENLGGRLLVQPTRFDEPANVYFALAADPTGASFGLLEV